MVGRGEKITDKELFLEICETLVFGVPLKGAEEIE
jgi:hypothetical protein